MPLCGRQLGCSRQVVGAAVAQVDLAAPSAPGPCASRPWALRREERLAPRAEGGRHDQRRRAPRRDRGRVDGCGSTWATHRRGSGVGGQGHGVGGITGAGVGSGVGRGSRAAGRRSAAVDGDVGVGGTTGRRRRQGRRGQEQRPATAPATSVVRPADRRLSDSPRSQHPSHHHPSRGCVRQIPRACRPDSPRDGSWRALRASSSSTRS